MSRNHLRDSLDGRYWRDSRASPYDGLGHEHGHGREQRQSLQLVLQQQREILQILAQQRAEAETRQRVSTDAFLRFLIHFEQSMAELRELVRGKECCQNTAAARAVEEAVVAAGKKASTKPSSASSQPITSAVQTLLSFEAKSAWKWRMKSTIGVNDVPDSLQDAVETAYRTYLLRGNIDRSCKHFEHDRLYINFDSRQGSYARQAVAFERVKI
jgi:hypothetical protein